MALTRSDLPADRFGEDMGAWRATDIAELLTRGLEEGRVISRLSRTRAFCIRQPVGKRREEWWARWSSTLGELFPRVGFLVTNLTLPGRAVVRFYNKRGIAEQWIKKGRQAVKMTRLSCHRFRLNEVRLWLSVIAHSLGNLRRPAGIAAQGRKLVADEFTATAGEDGRKVGETWPLLLAAVGGESSDETFVFQQAEADSWVAASVGIA
ncbi:MAG: transposase [Terriglobia bacterium]